MSRLPAKAFNQRKVKSAMKGALDAGMTWARIKANCDGSMEFSAGIGAPLEHQSTDLDKWMNDHARSFEGPQ